MQSSQQFNMPLLPATSTSLSVLNEKLDALLAPGLTPAQGFPTRRPRHGRALGCAGVGGALATRSSRTYHLEGPGWASEGCKLMR
jgi:hypothetical protein